tara:strand:+ start:1484 stop:1738 length:255 start_codon:yes stop_codon:yes gene_type:complete
MRRTTRDAVQLLELAVLVLGVGGVFLMVGRRDADLDHVAMDVSQVSEDIAELAGITRDLASSVVRGEQRLDELSRRLILLESRQ